MRHLIVGLLAVGIGSLAVDLRIDRLWAGAGSGFVTAAVFSTPNVSPAATSANQAADKQQTPSETSASRTDSKRDSETEVARARETRIPSASADACLQRFIDECVEIRPGTGPYPQDFPFGPHAQQPDGPQQSGRSPGSREAAETEEADDRRLEDSSPRLSLLHPFRICRYEMTQELYEIVMGVNPSRWRGPRNSAESMTFEEAQQCCTKLTAMLQATRLLQPNEVVRLPTEQEWEYCCRAGTTTRYSFGDTATAAGDEGVQASVLNQFAWHTGNAAGNDPAVGVLRPSAWGLYDMHGYLWEFVTHDPLSRPASQTPAGLTEPAADKQTAAPVMVRGGSWKDHHSQLTCTSRRMQPADRRDDAVGFRCVIAEKPVAGR